MSTTTAPIILILGSGSNIGHGVAEAFASKGYNLALVSRSISEETSTPTELHIKADLSDTSVVPKIFTKVQDTFGSPPSVVVYNAFSRTINLATQPLDISMSQLTHDMAVNTYSVLASASLAVKGFESLPSSASKTFIFTGNILNEVANPPVLGFGMGKAATAHLIDLAALTHERKGFKFYYADQRLEDGMPVMMARSGEAAAKFYTWLAEQEEQGPWQATHVNGVYTAFPRRSRLTW